MVIVYTVFINMELRYTYKNIYVHLNKKTQRKVHRN